MKNRNCRAKRAARARANEARQADNLERYLSKELGRSVSGHELEWVKQAIPMLMRRGKGIPR